MTVLLSLEALVIVQVYQGQIPKENPFYSFPRDTLRKFKIRF